MCSCLESELATVRQEKESLTQQLLNTIKHKVALSQELEAWQVGRGACTTITPCTVGFLPVTGPSAVLQEDMRLVINQQVLQQEEERKVEKEKTGNLQRSKSLRVKGEAGKGFFSFFKDK